MSNLVNTQYMITTSFPHPDYAYFKCTFLDSVFALYIQEQKVNVNNFFSFELSNSELKEIVKEYLHTKGYQHSNNKAKSNFVITDQNNGEDLIHFNTLFPDFQTNFMVYSKNNFDDIPTICHNHDLQTEFLLSNKSIIFIILSFFIICYLYVKCLKINKENVVICNSNLEVIHGDMKSLHINNEVQKDIFESYAIRLLRYHITDFFVSRLVRSSKTLFFNTVIGMNIGNNFLLFTNKTGDFKNKLENIFNAMIESNSSFEYERITVNTTECTDEQPLKISFDLHDYEHLLNNQIPTTMVTDSNSSLDITKSNDNDFKLTLTTSIFNTLLILPQGRVIAAFLTQYTNLMKLFSDNDNFFYYENIPKFIEMTAEKLQTRRILMFTKNSKKGLKVIAQSHSSDLQDVTEDQINNLLEKVGDNFVGIQLFKNTDKIFDDSPYYLIAHPNRKPNVYTLFNVDFQYASCIFDAYLYRINIVILTFLYQASETKRRSLYFNRVLSIVESSHRFSFIEGDKENNFWVPSNLPEETSLFGHQGISKNFENLDFDDKEQFQRDLHELYENGKPIVQSTFQTTDQETNTKHFGSLNAIRKFDKITKKPFICILYEDLTDLHNKQMSLNIVHKDLKAAMSALGLHRCYVDESKKIILADDSLYTEIGRTVPQPVITSISSISSVSSNSSNSSYATPPLYLADIVYHEDLPKIQDNSTLLPRQFISISMQRLTPSRQSNYQVRPDRNKLIDPNIPFLEKPHETPVVNPDKSNSIVLRLLNGKGETVWYSYISDGKDGFIFSVDDVIKTRRQLQTADRSLKVASASFLTFSFWRVDVRTMAVQQLLKYETIWDILNVDANTPFTELASYEAEGHDMVKQMLPLLGSPRFQSWNGDILFKTPRWEKWFRVAISKSNDLYLNCFMMDITQQKKMEVQLLQSTKLRDLTLQSSKISLWTFSKEQPKEEVPHNSISDGHILYTQENISAPNPNLPACDPLNNPTHKSISLSKLSGFQAKQMLGRHQTSLQTPKRYAHKEPETILDLTHVPKDQYQFNMDKTFVNKYVDPSSQTAFLDAIEKAFQTPTISVDCSILVGKSWYSARGKYEEKTKKVIGVLCDITELKQALIDLEKQKEKAAKANKDKSMFLANMSHEICTPLNGIVGLLDILEMYFELSELQRLITFTIRNESFSLLKIVKHSLNSPNLEDGSPIEITYNIFDVSHTFQSVAIANASQSLKIPIKFVFEISPRFPTLVYGDSQVLLHITNNLLSNALKFTKEGQVSVKIDFDYDNKEIFPLLAEKNSNPPEVSKPPTKSKINRNNSLDMRHNTLTLQNPERAGKYNEFMIITVSDTGIGMSEEQQNVIFNRFSQADPSVARYFGGSGLGLSLIRDLICAIAGRISFTSEYGKGTTFIARVPLDSISCPSQVPLLRIPNDPQNLPAKIIIVAKDKEDITYIDSYVSFYDGESVFCSCFSELCQLLNYNPDGTAGAYDEHIVCVLVDIESAGQELSIQVHDAVRNHYPNLLLFSMSMPGCSCGFSRSLTKPLMPNALHMLFNYLRFPNQKSHLTNLGPSTEKKQQHLFTQDKDKPKKILVVDDNVNNQFVMKKMLTKLGLKFEIAENGKVAVDYMINSGEDFNLVFMDCQMPVMNGLEATRAIRRLDSSKNNKIPIVALTAAVIEGDEETCHAAGMNGYLSKPVRLQQITDAIRKYST